MEKSWTKYEKKFYEELNGNCNIEKLKNIANEKIFLYESLFKYSKIKYEKFVIKTSFESYQNFMIYILLQKIFIEKLMPM